MKTKSKIALEGTCSGDVVGGLLSWAGENLQALLFFKGGVVMTVINIYWDDFSKSFVARSIDGHAPKKDTGGGYNEKTKNRKAIHKISKMRLRLRPAWTPSI